MQDFYVKDILEATKGRLLCGDESVCIETMSTNSKEIGTNCLFVPVIGERVDAHRFIDSAIEAGAVAVLTSEHDSFDSDVPYIRVANTVTAMQEIGRYYGRRMDIPKVGITGSVGKTTTKEMVACALSAGFKVFKTSGNSNSQIGVPNTLSQITEEDEIAVIEMGMSMPGEMKRLAELVELDSAIVTNIGVSHIEQLGTRDGICAEKFHIADALNSDGVIFLNGDDEILLKHMNELKVKTVLFGMGENNDYRAVNIMTGDTTEFDIEKNGANVCHVKLNVPGLHNVRNGLVAVAVAQRYGIEPVKSAQALEKYGGVAMRQQIIQCGGVTVIDDSYNASPDSMKAGIDVLCSVGKGRRIAVLADMLELGNNAPEYHYRVGEFIASHSVDELVSYGELAVNIDMGAATNPDIIIRHFEKREQIDEYLKDELKDGDTVLFKGSRGMKLNECVNALCTKRS